MIDGMSWSFRCRIVFTFLDMYMSPRALVPYAHILRFAMPSQAPGLLVFNSALCLVIFEAPAFI